MGGSRHQARKRALDVLYQADLCERPIDELLTVHRSSADPPEPFTIELVGGVERHRSELDLLISTHARDWKLSRMPVVDRNVLRLALFEMLHTEVPIAVAIDEAVELAKELSTGDSGRFVNGILARVAESRATA